MSDESFEQDELEYNDGLGDLLREKEQVQFSWTKTIAVVLVLALLLGAGVYAFIKSTTGDKTPVTVKTETHHNYSTRKADLTAKTDAHIQTLNIKAPSGDDSDDPYNEPIATLEFEAPAETVNEAPAAAKPAVSKAAKPVTAISKQSTPKTIYRVIAGNFSSKVTSQAMVKKLSKANVDSFVRTLSDGSYQVQVGAFSSEVRAKDFAKQVKAKGINTKIVSKP